MSRRARSLISTRTLYSSEPCIFCSSALAFSQQKRWAQYRAAPSVRRKQREGRAAPVTPEERDVDQFLEQRFRELVQENSTKTLTLREKAQSLQVPEQIAQKLSNNVAIFLYYFRRAPTSVNENGKMLVPVDAFQRCLKLSNTTVDQIGDVVPFLRSTGIDHLMIDALKLEWCCSRAGHADSTIKLAARLFYSSADDPGLLKRGDGRQILDSLRPIAEKGNIRAMIILGKIENRKGHDNESFEIWERAMKLIVELDKPENALQKAEYNKTLDENSTPWNELGFGRLRRAVHAHRMGNEDEAKHHRTKALEAYLTGIDQDDPMSHYNLAVLLDNLFDGRYSEDWLFHMTKAAASGHFKAAWELGVYYAEEPPSPPPVNNDAVTTTSYPFLNNILTFLRTALIKPTLSVSEEDSKSHAASFPSDTLTRVKLANEWLHLSARYHYSPAHLALARLHLQPHLSLSRKLSSPLSPTSPLPTPEQEQIPNPFHSPQRAHHHLSRILLASRLIAQQNAAVAHGQPVGNSHPAAKTLLSSYLSFPESLEDWGPRIDEYVAEAKGIAEGVGMDISDEAGMFGVMYFHRGSQVKRGDGMMEVLGGVEEDGKEWVVGSEAETDMGLQEAGKVVGRKGEVAKTNPRKRK